jgi:hypothetical protein
MPYLIEMTVAGTLGDLATRLGPKYATRAQADADMAKIHEARALWDGENYAEAQEALPDWLTVDAGLILSASVGMSRAR